MIYKDYMLYPVTLERMTGKDPDTRMDSYGAPEVIKVFRHGGLARIHTGQGDTTVSMQKYSTVDDIKIGDKINGQVVQSVEIVPEFDGSEPLFEVTCW